MWCILPRDSSHSVQSSVELSRTLPFTDQQHGTILHTPLDCVSTQLVMQCNVLMCLARGVYYLVFVSQTPRPKRKHCEPALSTRQSARSASGSILKPAMTARGSGGNGTFGKQQEYTHSLTCSFSLARSHISVRMADGQRAIVLNCI